MATTKRNNNKRINSAGFEPTYVGQLGVHNMVASPMPLRGGNVSTTIKSSGVPPMDSGLLVQAIADVEYNGVAFNPKVTNNAFNRPILKTGTVVNYTPFGIKVEDNGRLIGNNVALQLSRKASEMLALLNANMRTNLAITDSNRYSVKEISGSGNDIFFRFAMMIRANTNRVWKFITQWKKVYDTFKVLGSRNPQYVERANQLAGKLSANRVKAKINNLTTQMFNTLLDIEAMTNMFKYNRMNLTNKARDGILVDISFNETEMPDSFYVLSTQYADVSNYLINQKTVPKCSDIVENMITSADSVFNEYVDKLANTAIEQFQFYADEMSKLIPYYTDFQAAIQVSQLPITNIGKGSLDIYEYLWAPVAIGDVDSVYKYIYNAIPVSSGDSTVVTLSVPIDEEFRPQAPFGGNAFLLASESQEGAYEKVLHISADQRNDVVYTVLPKTGYRKIQWQTVGNVNWSSEAELVKCSGIPTYNTSVTDYRTVDYGAVKYYQMVPYGKVRMGDLLTNNYMPYVAGFMEFSYQSIQDYIIGLAKDPLNLSLSGSSLLNQ